MDGKLGVEMTSLRPSERKMLMQGMFLRRLPEAKEFTRNQVFVGIAQDLLEIRKRFSVFKFDTYVRTDADEFFNEMISTGLVNKRVEASKPDESEMVKEKIFFTRGPDANVFEESFEGDLEWLLDTLPMSTRGMFDMLKVDPEREVTMTVQEFLDKHTGEDKKVIKNEQFNKSDHQLKA